MTHTHNSKYNLKYNEKVMEVVFSREYMGKYVERRWIDTEKLDGRRRRREVWIEKGGVERFEVTLP